MAAVKPSQSSASSILISGGSGFLGRALTSALWERGEMVTWLTRDTTQPHPDGITLINYNELAPDQRYDAIINLAGAGIADQRWSESRKALLLESRLKPTKALLEFLRHADHKPQQFISGSAIGWYGTQGDKPLDESGQAEPDFPHRLCQQWEAKAQEAATLGIPVTIVRTGVVLHPEGGMLARIKTPFALGLGGKLGNGQQILSWISREDWVAAVCFLLAHPETSGVYNLTAPHPVSNANFTHELGSALHRPTILCVPAFALKLALGDMSTLLLDGQKVLPKRLIDAGFAFTDPTLEEALTRML